MNLVDIYEPFVYYDRLKLGDLIMLTSFEPGGCSPIMLYKSYSVIRIFDCHTTLNGLCFDCKHDCMYICILDENNRERNVCAFSIKLYNGISIKCREE